MEFARLATAKTLCFGPVLDSAGAEYTGAAVGDIKICKNNGTPAALNGSATLLHKEVGYYELVLTTSDISVVGASKIVLSKTTYVAPPITLVILPAVVYDAFIAGTDEFDVNVTKVLGTAVETSGSIDANLISIDGETSLLDLLVLFLGVLDQVTGQLDEGSFANDSDITDVPGVTASPIKKLRWLFAKTRNKATTDKDTSKEQLFADNGSTVIGEASISSDGTTFTRGKFAAP